MSIGFGWVLNYVLYYYKHRLVPIYYTVYTYKTRHTTKNKKNRHNRCYALRGFKSVNLNSARSNSGS